MKNTGKLDQLTALRFFAALMIVFHHANGLFGVGSAPVNLGQGVSFFFVLSGFILAYVYPRLDGAAEMRRFYLARFARIWPAYFVTFLIAFVLLPFQWRSVIGIAHLAMVQSWLPLSILYFSYNAVAWSISTEVGFYVLFPLLIRDWRTTWFAKLAVAAGLLILLVVLATWLQLPDYGDPYNGDDGWKATVHGLIYVNPIARLLEFVAGMVIARFWHGPAKPSPSRTLVEVISVAFAVGMMFASLPIERLVRFHLGDAAALWVAHSGGFIGFAILVLVMAQGGGAVSRALRWAPLVFLGEISFSMYLLHQTLLSVWRSKAAAMPAMPTSLALMAFFAVLLTSSFLVWRLVELPSRRWIVGPRWALSAAPAGG